uniref:Uncharacterized protein n=1 Tax=Rhodnius prolixus TaxID=13249 RepID=T1H844_RHOPR
MDSCKPLFKENRILTLPSLFIYANIMHIKNNEKNVLRSDEHSYNLRSKNDLHLPRRRLCRSDKAPGMMAARMFNKIPQSIRNTEKKEFQKIIKDFLLNNMFYKIEDFLSSRWTVTHFKVEMKSRKQIDDRTQSMPIQSVVVVEAISSSTCIISTAPAAQMY